VSRFAKSTPTHTEGTPLKGHAGIAENQHDPYAMHAKPAEPTWCPECGAVFEQGRWQWKERLSGHAPQMLCAACRRTRDNVPAGIVQIDGDYALAHRAELLAMLQHRADRAKAEHPLQRIMAITESGTSLEVSTTDIHLAHELAQALHHAYHGDLQLSYSDQQVLLRARWRR
jgi:NMD protein affecting ribosome stability and mRNA decay